MKKYFIIISLIISSLIPNISNAQKGEKLIGILAGYNTENKSALAGIAFQYRFSKYFRISPNIQYVFKNNSISAYEINLNAHVPFALDTKLNFYPLAGVSYQSWRTGIKGEDTYTYNKFGFNIGAGLEYMATSSLKVTLEGNYSWIKRHDSGGFFIGLGYLF